MKFVVILFALILFFKVYLAKEFSFDSIEYSPKKSDLINYGTLRLLKSRTKKNTFSLKGNFTIKRQLGNEKLVTFEVFTKSGILLTRTTYAFCEFTKVEKMIWPDLIKHSNMPQDNPCPFPVVNQTSAIFISCHWFYYRVNTKSISLSWMNQDFLEEFQMASFQSKLN